LILATICGFLTFKFPFVTGTVLDKEISRSVSVEAGSNLFLLVTTGASIILSAVAIFFYKDRKMQINLCYTGIGLTILILILYILEMKNLLGPTLALSCIFVPAMLAGYILAAKGIHKDEKLVKSLDKLR
jgi:hypothetical protein